jgi:hypothetical protein
LDQKNTKEISEYKEFIKKYWRSVKLRKSWGLSYRLFFILKRMIFGHDQDIASERPRVLPYVAGHEPVYHYLKLRPAKPFHN